MPLRPVESKQPLGAVQRDPRSTTGSDFKMAPSDTECLEQALREYHEASWDDSSFGDVPLEVQHTILRRAQEIKSRHHRLRSFPDLRHAIAS